MTTKQQPLTDDDLDRMERDRRWAGFGYLGERRNFRALLDEPGADHPSYRGRITAAIEAADAAALQSANQAGMDYEALFEWANSKNGRWYADCMFGNYGRHADLYLPGQPQH